MTIITVEFTHMGEPHTRILFSKEEYNKWLEEHSSRVTITSMEEEELPDKELYGHIAQDALDNPENYGLV